MWRGGSRETRKIYASNLADRKSFDLWCNRSRTDRQEINCARVTFKKRQRYKSIHDRKAGPDIAPPSGQKKKNSHLTQKGRRQKWLITSFFIHHKYSKHQQTRINISVLIFKAVTMIHHWSTPVAPPPPPPADRRSPWALARLKSRIYRHLHLILFIYTQYFYKA